MIMKNPPRSLGLLALFTIVFTFTHSKAEAVEPLLLYDNLNVRSTDTRKWIVIPGVSVIQDITATVVVNEVASPKSILTTAQEETDSLGERVSNSEQQDTMQEENAAVASREAEEQDNMTSVVFHEISQSLLLGVSSGVVASALVLLIGFGWKRGIEPWWENLVYKDAEIEGRWNATMIFDEDGTSGEEKELWELKRHGHYVTGTVTVITGTDRGRTYKLEGTFRNLILAATYENTDKRAIDRGSITVMLIENGTKFHGYMAYYYDGSHKVLPAEYICVRE